SCLAKREIGACISSTPAREFRAAGVERESPKGQACPGCRGVACLPVAEGGENGPRDVLTLEATLGELVVAHARQGLEALGHGARLADPIQELGNPLAQPIKGCRGPPQQVVDCKSGHDDWCPSQWLFVTTYIAWYYIYFTTACCIAAILRCMPFQWQFLEIVMCKPRITRGSLGGPGPALGAAKA